MRGKYFILFVALLTTIMSKAQTEKDSLSETLLDEIIITHHSPIGKKHKKNLSTVEEYLETNPKIQMIKRGAYAWEPYINGMSTERTVITIDGMRIFGACTDKMDPITSYVEISNLSKAEVSSGAAACSAGPTIGGAIHLKRYNANRYQNGLNARLVSGLESNNMQRILGGAIGYSNNIFYLNTDAMYRKANNYTAGENKEIKFSQFSKYNLSLTAGINLNKHHLIEASSILDQANNVGYPTLPMDVSLAKAFIGYLKHEYKPINSWINLLETKVYYNNITHIMDDTKRPQEEIFIHMDMPGWSETLGTYYQINTHIGKHQLSANVKYFNNLSTAEMTMYPKNKDEKPMFMYTWPKVNTYYTGISIEDTYKFAPNYSLLITMSGGWQHSDLKDQQSKGYYAIFYPEPYNTNQRHFLKSLSLGLSSNKNNWNYQLGIGYSERAPSVSEAYGFYLYNASDFYEYIGNPNLKPEQSFEINANAHYYYKNLKANLSLSNFFIKDYIIGKIYQNNGATSVMNYGLAVGTKVYSSINYANIFNSNLLLEYTFLNNWNAKMQLSYHLGKESKGNNLPFISPLAYKMSINYHHKNWFVELNSQGNAQHTNYAPNYGEILTPAYTIYGTNAKYTLHFNNFSTDIQLGIENIFNTYYTTYADWNNNNRIKQGRVGRMGRNFFINLAFNI